MEKKIIKLSQKDLNKIINESIENLNNQNELQQYLDSFNSADEIVPGMTQRNGDNDEFVDLSDVLGYNEDESEDAVEEELMELCAEGSRKFNELIEIIKENGYTRLKKYNYNKVLERLENICNLINKIWDE